MPRSRVDERESDPKNSSPSVWVIVLAWNACEDTLDCLSSLKFASDPNVHILVVDNGSTDGTASAIRAKFPFVCVIENRKNLGYAEGNNVGLRYALDRKADYVLVLNNDTVVDANALGAFLKASEAYPLTGIFGAKVYWYSDPKQVWFEGAKWVPERAVFTPLFPNGGQRLGVRSTAYETDYANGCALFFRARLAQDIGLFDPRFFLTWEEADWCYRARRHGYTVMVEPDAKVWHKVSRSFADRWKGTKYEYYYTRNRWLWIEKNLAGGARRQAFMRCLREASWSIIEMLDSRRSQSEQAVAHARLRGNLDFILRRFGPNPMFEAENPA